MVRRPSQNPPVRFSPMPFFATCTRTPTSIFPLVSASPRTRTFLPSHFKISAPIRPPPHLESHPGPRPGLLRQVGRYREPPLLQETPHYDHQACEPSWQVRAPIFGPLELVHDRLC